MGRCRAARLFDRRLLESRTSAVRSFRIGQRDDGDSAGGLKGADDSSEDGLLRPQTLAPDI